MFGVGEREGKKPSPGLRLHEGTRSDLKRAGTWRGSKALQKLNRLGECQAKRVFPRRDRTTGTPSHVWARYFLALCLSFPMETIFVRKHAWESACFLTNIEANGSQELIK